MIYSYRALYITQSPCAVSRATQTGMSDAAPDVTTFQLESREWQHKVIA